MIHKFRHHLSIGVCFMDRFQTTSVPKANFEIFFGIFGNVRLDSSAFGLTWSYLMDWGVARTDLYNAVFEGFDELDLHSFGMMGTS